MRFILVAGRSFSVYPNGTRLVLLRRVVLEPIERRSARLSICTSSSPSVAFEFLIPSHVSPRHHRGHASRRGLSEVSSALKRSEMYTAW